MFTAFPENGLLYKLMSAMKRKFKFIVLKKMNINGPKGIIQANKVIIAIPTIVYFIS